jgi:hypothetical protein
VPLLLNSKALGLDKEQQVWIWLGPRENKLEIPADETLQNILDTSMLLM